MRRVMGRLALLLLAAVSTQARAQSVSFLACPVAQDRGPERDVCFFAQHEGVRYTLSNPTDWGSPELKHKVLVEGKVVDQPGFCGGLSLEGRVSVMPELSHECDTIAPYDVLPPPPVATGPQAEKVAAELAAIAIDPSRSLQSVPLLGAITGTITPGVTETIYYPYESDRSSGPDASRMVLIARLAKTLPQAHIKIVSYRGASLLDNGTIVAESARIAGQRAQKVSGILAGLGSGTASFATELRDEPATPTGQEDWKSRRVEITVHASKVEVTPPRPQSCVGGRASCKPKPQAR